MSKSSVVDLLFGLFCSGVFDKQQGRKEREEEKGSKRKGEIKKRGKEERKKRRKEKDRFPPAFAETRRPIPTPEFLSVVLILHFTP